jgi:hypothetical protein
LAYSIAWKQISFGSARTRTSLSDFMLLSGDY